jgi:hypothetical protein
VIDSGVKKGRGTMKGDKESPDQMPIDLSVVRDLRARVGELEEAVRRLNGLGADLQSVKSKPGQDLGATGLAPKSSAVVSRRRAFGVGALVSLLAYISRNSARAADALTIKGDKVDISGSLNLGQQLDFGARLGVLIKLYNNDYTIGIQGSTPYFRSGKNFAWYQGGSHNDGELNPGTNGKTLMTLTPDKLSVSDSISANGTLSTNGGLSIAGGNADFGARLGVLIKLYNNDYTIGIQGSTTYFRSGKNFAWYQGGSHNDGELNPGTNGKTLMTLTPSGVKIGDQYAAGGARPLRIISGSVYWDGNDQGRGTADGYSVAKIDTGLYDIKFKQPFSDLPGASVTQVYTPGADPFNENNNSTGGAPLDNAVIVAVSKTRLRLKTGTSNQKVEDRAFSFVVIGPV